MCSPAISQTGSVEGNISDKETSSKIQDVYVFLENTQFNTQSDEDGHYIIKEIPVGNYILIISFPGFKIISREINIISGNITKVNEELTASTITTGEIIVTSQRYKSRLKDVSLPMEVVDKYEIQKSTAQTVSELLDKKSGLSLTRDGIWATDISIRGLSKNNIVTLIDGDRIETANDLSARLSMIDLNDIERVEVIKGGASSLYGTGAFGGIVNIFSKNAFYNSKFYIKGFLSSSYNSVNNNGIGNISINTGAPKWYLKLAGSFRNAKNTETPDGEIKTVDFPITVSRAVWE